jgi:hypothetical protein
MEDHIDSKAGDGEQVDSILDADRYSVAQAASRTGVHVSTLHRWHLRGVRGRRLRTVLIGGRRYVLASDLNRFLAEINQRPSLERTPERRLGLAEAQLDELGV